jgi:hypothetical protein
VPEIGIGHWRHCCAAAASPPNCVAALRVGAAELCRNVSRELEEGGIVA